MQIMKNIIDIFFSNNCQHEDTNGLNLIETGRRPFLANYTTRQNPPVCDPSPYLAATFESIIGFLIVGVSKKLGRG